MEITNIGQYYIAKLKLLYQPFLIYITHKIYTNK